MGGNLKDRWNIPITAVANEFIDEYMAGANGEYVKVYLYILRHQSSPLTIDMIADGLNHTESDVRRALAYWLRLGVLSEGAEGARDSGAGSEGSREEDSGLEVWSSDRSSGELISEKETAATGGQATFRLDQKRNRAETQLKEPVYSQESVNRLAQDEAFSQLLYIAQK